jgi:GAF domain-containing protein
MAAALPANEKGRLRQLELLRVLDTAADKTLDELTRLASLVCEAPISMISLIDKNRQWFKSRNGLDAVETTRDEAFCAHAILGDELMIVEDASKDVRFQNYPSVTSDPHIRFYAGAPLIVAGGYGLGTLCVIDRKPRVLNDFQKSALKVLSVAVVSQLELRRAQSELKAIEQLLPMCAWCRSVRLEDNSWKSLHEYVMDHVDVTHSICPECANSR